MVNCGDMVVAEMGWVVICVRPLKGNGSGCQQQHQGMGWKCGTGCVVEPRAESVQPVGQGWRQLPWGKQLLGMQYWGDVGRLEVALPEKVVDP